MNATVLSTRELLAAPGLYVSLALLLMMIGGSLFEHLVVDPAWPDNLSVIQPEQGGVNRKIFWIPIHIATTVALLVALWANWHATGVRNWVIAGIACYVVMRAWSAVYFIPLALEFEAAADMTSALRETAERWVTLSVVRSLLVVGAAGAFTVAALRT
mgnify:FL=1